MTYLFRKLKNLKRHKENGGKEGSSMVSVVIGVLFLSAIALTILTVATRYVVSVIVDRGSSNNFYQTEGILEEVKTGLLEYAGDASETAYKEILENYSKKTGEMKEAFAKKYFSEFAEKLTDTVYTWDDSKLGVVQNCEIERLSSLTKEPGAVKTLPGTDLGFVINYDTTKGYTLTIKNLMIDYTNPTEYRSSIQTDIVFKVPDFKFEGDSTLDELKDYIVISDDTLKVENSNGAGVTFTGNVYTGNRETGIEIGTQNGAAFRSQKIISRGSLDIFTGARVDMAGETGAGDCYLQNICLKPRVSGDDSTLSTHFTMNENAYIANDLNIGDSNSVVSLSGKYYGYSYNEENTTSTITPRSDYSSAILVNGLNTTLNTDGLDKMILAGRTFVSRNSKSTGGVTSSVVSDIMMGESLAVKSNQIAYMLPNEYIKAEHNPVLESEDRTILTESLLNSDIGKYLDSTKPYAENFNNNGYVYFYLKFKDEKSVNEYFKNYYEGTSQDEDGNTVSNKSLLDERAKAYISTSDASGMKLSPNLFLIAGNIIHNYYAASGSGKQQPNYYDNTGKPKQDLLDDGKRIGKSYVGMQLTLLPSGVSENYPDGTTPATPPDSMRLAEGVKPLVEGRIIDFSKLTGVIDKTDSKSGGRVYATPGDYTVDGSISKGIIISGGNVEVTGDFTGLILAKGKVTANNNKNLTADIIMTGKLMEFIKSDKDLSKIFHALNGTVKQDSTNLSECISYQNWKRNEE